MDEHWDSDDFVVLKINMKNAICLVPRLLYYVFQAMLGMSHVYVVGVNEDQRPLAFLASIHTGSYSLPAEAVFRRSAYNKSIF